MPVIPPVPLPCRSPVSVEAPVPPPPTGSPVALVRTRAEGVPRAGVMSVGEVALTTSPVPVHVKRDEVATAVGVAALPVMFPITELAARVASMPRVTLFAPIAVAREPAVVVTSPVSAGNCAAARVPTTFERLTLREEGATHEGRPGGYELGRKPPVEVARAVMAAVPPLPKRSCPSEIEES